MRTTKKKVYKFSEKSRTNQSVAGKRRWDAMTPEQQQEQIAKLQAARQQKKLESKQNNPYIFNPSVAEQGSVVTPRTLALAKQETPMQKNLEILRVRVGKRVGFEVNTEQAIEFLVNKWGVQGI